MKKYSLLVCALSVALFASCRSIRSETIAEEGVTVLSTKSDWRSLIIDRGADGKGFRTLSENPPSTARVYSVNGSASASDNKNELEAEIEGTLNNRVEKLTVATERTALVETAAFRLSEMHFRTDANATAAEKTEITKRFTDKLLDIVKEVLSAPLLQMDTLNAAITNLNSILLQLGQELNGAQTKEAALFAAGTTTDQNVTDHFRTGEKESVRERRENHTPIEDDGRDRSPHFKKWLRSYQHLFDLESNIAKIKDARVKVGLNFASNLPTPDTECNQGQ